MFSVLWMPDLWVCEKSCEKAIYNPCPQNFFKVSPSLYTDCSPLLDHFSVTSVWMLTSSVPVAYATKDILHGFQVSRWVFLLFCFVSAVVAWQFPADSTLIYVFFLQKLCQHVCLMPLFLGMCLVILYRHSLSKRNHRHEIINGRISKTAIGKQLQCLLT